MFDKKLLQTSSTSYSQFLEVKQPVHSWTETAASPIDINLFSRSVSLHYQHLYATKKWQNIFYRYIFFAFSFLFFALGMMIFFKTTNPLCSLYFGNCSLIKNGVNLGCMLLAIGSFMVGYKIHPEKEAIKHLIRRIESQFNGPAKHIQIEFNAILANLSRHWMEPQQVESD